MKYSTVLIDADETILDFFSTEENALRHSFETFRLPYREETHAVYHEINKRLWHEFSMGRMDKPTLTVKRFEELFGTLGLEADPAAFKACYEGWIAKGFYAVPGAKSVLEALRSRGLALYCTTNGLKNTQFSRLTGAGMLPLFDGVFVSEEAGSQKPQRAYFDYVFSRILERDSRRVLLVGDSLTTDVAGGNGAGIDTVWYNPNAEPADAEIRPTFEIRDLEELLGIVD